MPSCLASRAEAWIETGHAGYPGRCRYLASRAEAWIETVWVERTEIRAPARLPRGGVD